MSKKESNIIKFKSTARSMNNQNYVTIPKRYVDDGYITINKKYYVYLEEIEEEK